MTTNDAIYLTRILITFSLVIQNFELWTYRKNIPLIWPWKIVQCDFSAPIKKLLSPFLGDRAFSILIGLRFLLLLLFVISPNPFITLLTLLSTLLIMFRWRGTFNGGSDFMTMIVLFAVLLTDLSSENSPLSKLALFYVGIQTTLSYFVAGIIKLKEPTWRTGIALDGFLSSSMYQLQILQIKWLLRPNIIRLRSWVVLIFELTFPIIFLIPELTWMYIGSAFLFHLANAYFFGLNRFVFAWLAAYPSLVFSIQSLHHQ